MNKQMMLVVATMAAALLPSPASAQVSLSINSGGIGISAPSFDIPPIANPISGLPIVVPPLVPPVLLNPPAANLSMRNGLPATTLDSFVTSAAESADMIYGDEGIGANPPPYFLFSPEHRIGSGFYGMTNAGLTTGHGSYMPSAWGRDEFIGGSEWCNSGPGPGPRAMVNGGPSGLDMTAYDEAQVAAQQAQAAANNFGLGFNLNLTGINNVAGAIAGAESTVAGVSSAISNAGNTASQIIDDAGF